jgi:hypothetical protein
MPGDFMTFLRNTVLAVILLAGSTGGATALSFKDIAGKWCGECTNYTFNRDTLVVVFHSGSPTKRFTVTNYEYLDDIVKCTGSTRARSFSRSSANSATTAPWRSRKTTSARAAYFIVAEGRIGAGNGGEWWALKGSNLRPLPCEGNALPLS